MPSVVDRAKMDDNPAQEATAYVLFPQIADPSKRKKLGEMFRAFSDFVLNAGLSSTKKTYQPPIQREIPEGAEKELFEAVLSGCSKLPKPYPPPPRILADYGLAPERWKRIPGYNHYEVSTRGNIRLRDEGRKISHIKVQRNGLLFTLLERPDGSVRYALLSRLVYETFNGEIPKGRSLYYRNGNSFDNSLKNLIARPGTFGERGVPSSAEMCPQDHRNRLNEQIFWGLRDREAKKKLVGQLGPVSEDMTRKLAEKYKVLSSGSRRHKASRYWRSNNEVPYRRSPDEGYMKWATFERSQPLTNEQEMWRDIQDFPGYQISSWGNVNRFAGGQWIPHGRYTIRRKNKIGRPVTMLQNEHGYKTLNIHVLVFDHFVWPDYREKTGCPESERENLEVHHKDHNCWNTFHRNLEGMDPEAHKKHHSESFLSASVAKQRRRDKAFWSQYTYQRAA